MAVTIHGTPTSYAAFTTSQTVTPDASPTGIVVSVLGGQDTSTGGVNSPAYGGIALTKAEGAQCDGLGLGTGGSAVYYILDISGRANDLLTCSSSFESWFSVAFIDGSTGSIALLDSGYDQAVGDVSLSCGAQIDCLGMSTEAVTSVSGADVDDVGPGTGMTTCAEYDPGGVSGGSYYIEGLSGVRADWTQNTGSHRVMTAIILGDGNYDVVQAAPYKLLLSDPTSAITGFNDAQIQTQPYRLYLKNPKHTVQPTAPRVLPLVGEELEMSGRVAKSSGLTTPLLSEVNSIPTWIEGSTFAERTRLVPLTTTGSSGDPELVWDDDDELVYTEHWED
jgi:hypothetical protein